MKILILGFAKYKYMPYAKFYLDSINKQANEVHLVVWNRDLLPEDYPKDIQIHEFKLFQEDQISRYKKIANFLRYKAYSFKRIQNIKPQRIIVLHTMPGILLFSRLVFRYSEKYIFDYRDITYENIWLFKMIVGQLVKHSYVTFISSEGFIKALPSNCGKKTIISHNLSMIEEEKYCFTHSIDKTRIIISFWGLIREEAINKEIISKLSNDCRFELHYYGREQRVALELKKYALSIGAKNVIFHGEYEPNQRGDFAAKTDLIHNLFDSANMMKAVSNKYYDGMLFKIPQICMTGSYMGKKVEDEGIGLACNPYESDFADKVFLYYQSIDDKSFNENAQKALDKVKKEYNEGQTIIASIFCSE